MELRLTRFRTPLLAGIAALALVPPALAAGQGDGTSPVQPLTIRAMDPAKKGDGTLSPAARAALTRGPLPAGPADVAAKAAADRAYDEAARAGKLPAATPAELAAAGGTATTPRAIGVAGGSSFAGLSVNGGIPSDATGAAGPTRYIQVVNGDFAIFNRPNNATVKEDLLLSLAGVDLTQIPLGQVYLPQIIWDPTTNRFYYVMVASFSGNDNQLAFGFSTTASPSSAADWCHYGIDYGANVPDLPTLGDSQRFALVGTNVHNSGGLFLGSDLLAIGKPPAGTTCPAPSAVTLNAVHGLVDATGRKVYQPVPANQVDASDAGYVVARNGATPSNKLWVFPVGRSATGVLTLGAAKALTLPFSYAVPPSATQPGLSQKLQTLDASPTQAVLARNPRRANGFSLWTQQTVANGGTSAVRWYEIDPAPATPTLLANGLIAFPGVFAFNAAISPDRRVDGATSAFGGSFVLTYDASSAAAGIYPRMVAASSLNGGALSSAVVVDSPGPYVDYGCPNAGQTCLWGPYSGAAPDPRPATTSTGAVWLTSQFSRGTLDPTKANWATWIVAAHP